MSVQIRHDVERHAENGLVLRDRDDRRQAREPRLPQRQLESRLPHHVVRRRRKRRPRRAPQHEETVVALEQEGEVRAAALADPPRPQLARAEAVLVEECANAVEHEQRRLRRLRPGPDGLDDVARTASCDRMPRCDGASISCGTAPSRTSPPTARRSVRTRSRSTTKGASRPKPHASSSERSSSTACSRAVSRARSRRRELVAPSAEVEVWPELRELRGARLARHPERAARGGVRARLPRSRPQRQALPRRRDDRRALRPRASRRSNGCSRTRAGTPCWPSSTAASTARSSRTR